MDTFHDAAVIITLIDALRNADSWCGETHVQKAGYVLKHLCHSPVRYRFVLYKHGPYSFDLADELALLQAREFTEIEPVPGYGSRLSVLPHGRRLCDSMPEIKAEEPRIRFVVTHLADKGVVELERITTALYVTLEPVASLDVNARAERLNALKPHVSVSDAIEAVRIVDKMRGEAASQSWYSAA